MRRVVPVLRVGIIALALLGALSGALAAVGQPASPGAGPLALPDPAPLSSVRYDEPPLKVLLVGDSMAGSLGVGLGELAAAYNVELVNAGHPDCSVAMDGHVQLGFEIASVGAPCVLDQPDRLLDVWRQWVDAFRPDVVIYLARSDILDLQISGHWTWIGRKVFNAWYPGRLDQMLSVFTSRGAKVVLMTMPVSQETIGGHPQQDNPVRIGRLGRFLRDAAAPHPGQVLVYNLARLLTPGFRYRSGVDGLALRCVDGVHLTPEAGIVVAADLFPRLWRLVGDHRVPGGGHWVGGPLPSSTPSWYSKLACS